MAMTNPMLFPAKNSGWGFMNVVTSPIALAIAGYVLTQKRKSKLRNALIVGGAGIALRGLRLQTMGATIPPPPAEEYPAEEAEEDEF